MDQGLAGQKSVFLGLEAGSPNPPAGRVSVFGGPVSPASSRARPSARVWVLVVPFAEDASPTGSRPAHVSSSHPNYHFKSLFSGVWG